MSHTLKGSYLRELLVNALKQGKDARCIVRFEVAGIEADVTLRFYKSE
jgi:hypothetical protein